MERVRQEVPIVRWEARGPADGPTARQLRLKVDDWIADELRVDDIRRSDMVLTVAEALANSAEHAYHGCSGPGEMRVAILLDDSDARVVIEISDHGTWTDPAEAPTNTARGRGLLLMRALADDVTLDAGPEGTNVRLHFHNSPGQRT